VADAPRLLTERAFDGYALLTTERAAATAPAIADPAAVVLHVPHGSVPEAAGAVREGVGGRPVVALGGGRVIDSAKAIGGADELPVAAVPTTLSGAELTRIHRMPAGVDRFTLVRPSLVVADPALMASQPMPALAASAMNALSHGVEALYTPFANPVAEIAALRAAQLISRGLDEHDPDRPALALGALLAGYAVGSTGYAFLHVLSQTLVRVAGTPHAQTYAVMLPHALRLMERRAPDVLARLATALGAEPGGAAERAAAIAARAEVTRLQQLGVTEADIEPVVSAALERAELQNTPDPPGASELAGLLRAAL
jgi:maleylacetate reductase